ncbi:MAG: phosphoribosylglycinamide formyltransferase [Candidatus Peregrinibacteria bacterium]|nr:phosphoribosylglycinamide formyltransferase [Candidatus Peregrinibacteria bacterium]MDZ4244703.1 phosphoribosylglycinamide formyltransferase [Candidatus Gracilibacteria bacterium]
MKKPFYIIVLASGNGTNLGAIIEAKNSRKLQNVEILGVISNRDAGALEKGREYGCPTVLLPSKGKTPEQYDEELIKMIVELEDLESEAVGKEVRVDLICLIGYMNILTPEFIQDFEGKIINVHPSLLPHYGGKGMYGDAVHEAVLASGDKETGMTIHYVTEEVDAGEMILQVSVSVEADDTIETLRQKVQAEEKLGYVEVLKRLSSGS